MPLPGLLRLPEIRRYSEDLVEVAYRLRPRHSYSMLNRSIHEVGFLLAVIAATPVEAAQMIMHVTLGPQGACRVLANDVLVDMDRIDEFARSVSKASDVVTISADASVPYRCVGGLIYSLQAAHVERVDFKTDVAVPNGMPPPILTAPHQKP